MPDAALREALERARSSIKDEFVRGGPPLQLAGRVLAVLDAEIFMLGPATPATPPASAVEHRPVESSTPYVERCSCGWRKTSWAEPWRRHRDLALATPPASADACPLDGLTGPHGASDGLFSHRWKSVYGATPPASACNCGRPVEADWHEAGCPLRAATPPASAERDAFALVQARHDKGHPDKVYGCWLCYWRNDPDGGPR